jgi:hypothetical protein
MPKLGSESGSALSDQAVSGSDTVTILSWCEPLRRRYGVGGKKGTLLRNGSYRGPDTLVGRGTDILQDTYIGHRL